MARIVIRCEYSGNYVLSDFDTQTMQSALDRKIASPSTPGPTRPSAQSRSAATRSPGGRSHWCAAQAEQDFQSGR